MRSLRPVLSTLALAAVLPAQVRVSSSMRTSGVYGVHANKVVRSLPDKTSIRFAAHVRASDGMFWRGLKASASTMLGHGRGWFGATSAHVMESGYARAGSSAGTTASATPAQAPHTVVLTLSATSSVKGKLVVSYHGRASTNGSASAKLSFGAHSFSAVANGKRSSKEFSGLSIGTSGLAITITTAGKAVATTRSESYSGWLTISFVPDPSTKCTFTRDKSSCTQGGTLDGTSSLGRFGHTITLKLAKGPADGFGLLLLSSKGDVSKIGTTNCVLLDSWIFAGFYRTDSSGDASTTIRAPSHRAMTAWAQALTLKLARNNISIATSNTLKIVCTP
ncbi:MAG: hypothetical protein ACE5F1_15085 [Planctomycetota bacterium]